MRLGNWELICSRVTTSLLPAMKSIIDYCARLISLWIMIVIKLNWLQTRFLWFGCHSIVSVCGHLNARLVLDWTVLYFAMHTHTRTNGQIWLNENKIERIERIGERAMWSEPLKPSRYIQFSSHIRRTTWKPFIIFANGFHSFAWCIERNKSKRVLSSKYTHWNTMHTWIWFFFRFVFVFWFGILCRLEMP